MDAHELIDILEGAGYEWREYSGRAMYGKQCVGVDLDGVGDLWELAQACPELPRPTTDSMGHGIIAYWPRFILESENA